MHAPHQRVLVTGAGGFIGRRVVTELLQRGHEVRALVRPDEAPMRHDTPGFSSMQGDVRQPGTMRIAVAGMDSVVSLAARKMDEPDSRATNVGGARNLVEACRTAGVGRIVNVSTQAAKLPRPGVYGATKREADEVFAASGLAITTVRPSLVYGPGDKGAFDTVRRFVEKLPIVPILGDGRWTLAPLHVDDVARAIVTVLETPATIGREYDLGGPELLTFDALVNKIALARGRKRAIVHVPLGIALAATRLVRWLWPSAPVSVSNVLGSNQEIHIDLEPARQDFQFDPRPVTKGLAELFGHATERHLRAEARRFGRHLLGRELETELQVRYAAASAKLFPQDADPVVHFIRRHPWSLSLLESAAVLADRQGELRGRLLALAAIMEASPLHAELFLRPPPSKGLLLLGLAWNAALGVAKIGLGLPIFFLIRRAHVLAAH